MDKIDRVYYINLKRRTDRNTEILAEFKNVGIPFEKVTRICAIDHKYGYIGCAMSHLIAIKDAIQNNYQHIVIFEDDFHFLVNKESFNKNLDNLFIEQSGFNVCMLAYNVFDKKKLTDTFFEVIDAQTASGYIVHRQFFATLEQCLQDSVQMLQETHRVEVYACDMLWKRYQGSDQKFLGFQERIGIQRKSYSDIEKRNVNYGC
jgi:glycosyl transferase family 25